jgi:hypothetical protein
LQRAAPRHGSFPSYGYRISPTRWWNVGRTWGCIRGVVEGKSTTTPLLLVHCIKEGSPNPHTESFSTVFFRLRFWPLFTAQHPHCCPDRCWPLQVSGGLCTLSFCDLRIRYVPFCNFDMKQAEVFRAVAWFLSPPKCWASWRFSHCGLLLFLFVLDTVLFLVFRCSGSHWFSCRK